MKLLPHPRSILLTLLCVLFTLQSAISFASEAKLVDYSYLGDFTTETAKQTLLKSPPLDTLEPKYSLRLYKIHYKTHAPDGSLTSASGLVAMPLSPALPPAIVSYHHGTRVIRSDVPSSNAVTNYVYLSVFASSGGYMLVMPDYLGMGDSELPLHPYVQSKTLASSSIDMLIASKELAKELRYPVNDKLFLAGYSEGGYTTVVTYEELLTHHKEIPVTAAAPGSAPYDWNETIHFITQKPGPRATLYLAYFFYSMQTYFHYWDGLDVIFKAPYDTLIPTLFDGNHEGSDIIKALPQNPHDLIQDAFLESLINKTDPHADDLIRNLNHYDFKSTSPMLIVGTKGDHNVPYHGAEIAYEHLSALSDKVYIKHVSDVLDHTQAAPLVLNEQLNFFKLYEH